jgi:protein TonB
VSAGNGKRILIWGTTGVVVLGAVAVAIIYLHNLFTTEPPPTKQVVQEIRLVRPPPPPENEPPPPPPPPKEEVHTDEPQPEPTPSDEPPPGEQLGLDAEGAGSGDSFGLVGRPGGRDLLASNGSAYTWYSGLIKNELLAQLNRRADTRNGTYSVAVKLWVRSDGTIEKVVLSSSSGNSVRDRAIEEALSQLKRISQAPPESMPQPINLRIVGRA